MCVWISYGNYIFDNKLKFVRINNGIGLGDVDDDDGSVHTCNLRRKENYSEIINWWKFSIFLNSNLNFVISHKCMFVGIDQRIPLTIIHQL